MTTTPRPRSRRLASAAWRIALAILPLGAGLALATILLPASDNPSAPGALGARIALGVAISAATLTVIALLVRLSDHRRMSDVGLTSVRTGWRLAVWGAIVWTIPAAATFGVLALLGAPLTVTVTGPELARTAILLLVAVLLAEALPEEAVFRGYVTTALGTLTRGWGIIIIQALLFTLFAALMRQNANPADLSLFLTMGIGFGYLRMITGSIWMPIGFHTAFQTGAQLVLTHDAIDFAGGTGAAMLALGVIPFSVAAILVSSTGIPRIVHPDSGGTR
ncbi:CPBP family intramembrane glutamic endopeptidase [Jonesia denitrificans]|uniref:Abortive infection protein n=1 Tax=Jonesia denitrificans (strain ATCC 14870 / DSM 20603 / BCRC 15368 / CIP 55.134 / JCM 11481 / NBRC 15587 / NCTC 10816 / Prevot 55134) TaxID=471856 RepID=C7R4U8_JONDD|nr:type II CAAX endopeptidase family protein [Jonesia denitrificans]ACV09118.1 Abortive infection protein [Jonesia denitrificans DSM 20603]ASE09600.1 CPBP family intramembrane metalloprotease [Jonesia denitrificans]QXB44141.1 CPBP family intramembrane metalloprotease [Jonesia denitrificans]SQH21317.1 CAAX amino terminal protease self- immunity [Jonesia denitrificans]